MAITSYSELQTEISTWAFNNGFETADVKNMISRAEKYLNRKLDAVQNDATITGVADSREIDTSSYSVDRPIALWRVDDNDEYPVTPKPDGSFAYDDTSGKPSFWSWDKNKTKIQFDRPLDEAYAFRFEFDEKFALSDSVTTNWLLTYHDDLYLDACLHESAVFMLSAEDAAFYGRARDAKIKDVRREIARTSPARLSVDPALVSIGQRNYFDGSFDD